MNEFTASNGLTVRRSIMTKNVIVDDSMGIPEKYIEAAAEFLEHQKNHKPWHDAKEGEVWLVTTRVDYKDVPAIVNGDKFWFQSLYKEDRADSISFEGVVSARRIYPEGE